MQLIKVGFCVAYDWMLLEHALPCVYADADVIWISIDIERRTWSGMEYAWDQLAFNRLIKAIDVENKIRIYEDNFHLTELTSMQNEVRQRGLLAEKMGENGWHIQLDCDEYFLHFKEFVKFLRSTTNRRYRYNVCCTWITLFKQVDNGFLYIVPKKGRNEYIQVATLTPHYEHGRRNGDFNLQTNFLIIHQSWARSEEELRQKIANWGHNNDFNQEAFLKMWIKLDASNYQQLNNFHPIIPETWSQLRLNTSRTIKELLLTFDEKDFPVYSKWQLILQNSLFVSRLRALCRRILKLK